MSKLLWMIGQATAIGGLTWNAVVASGNHEKLGAFLLLNTIIVAFLTAVIVNLWDWLRRPRTLAGPGKIREPERERLSAPAPSWFLGKPPEKGF